MVREAFAFLICVASAPAQFGHVMGYVNGADGKPVAGASVVFDQIGYKTPLEFKTDKRGFYQVFTLRNGDYNVTVKVNGRVRAVKEAYHVSPGRQDVALTFKLEPEEKVELQLARYFKTNAGLPGNRELVESFESARSALAAAQYPQAIEILTKAVAADAKQAGLWSLLADAYLGGETPAFDQAAAAFRKAVALAPSDARVYNAYAVALAGQGKTEEGLRHLRTAAQLDSAGTGAYAYNAGAILLNTGQAAAAIAEFRRSIAADPRFADSYYQLAAALVQSHSGEAGTPREAITSFQKYVELAPDGPHAAAARAILSASNGRN